MCRMVLSQILHGAMLCSACVLLITGFLEGCQVLSYLSLSFLSYKENQRNAQHHFWFVWEASQFSAAMAAMSWNLCTSYVNWLIWDKETFLGGGTAWQSNCISHLSTLWGRVWMTSDVFPYTDGHCHELWTALKFCVDFRLQLRKKTSFY